MKRLTTMLAGRFALALQGQLPLRLKREEGQTLVEYAMMLGFIAIALITAVMFLQHQINSLYTRINNAL
jgi:Flp pilus assembly pilin Flp